MKKNSKKAITVFKNYITELDGITDSITGNTWKAKVNDTIVLYLGVESSFAQRLEKLYFTDKETHAMERAFGLYEIHIFNPANKENFKNLIKAIIHYIEQNGVKADYFNINFLSQFSTAQILGALLACGTLVFWLGWFVGGTQKDREIIQIEREKEKDAIKINELQILLNKATVKKSGTK